jgi:NifU-like protein involved in Fe-S cluster formation
MRDLMAEIGERIGKQAASSTLEADRGRGSASTTGRSFEDEGIIGQVTGKCGETMVVCLTIEGDRITDITAYTDGCSSSVLCGLIVADLAKGKTLDQAAEIGGDSILMEAKDLPEAETHCAYLAAAALQAAILNWTLRDHDVGAAQ